MSVEYLVPEELKRVYEMERDGIEHTCVKYCYIPRDQEATCHIDFLNRRFEPTVTITIPVSTPLIPEGYDVLKIFFFNITLEDYLEYRGGAQLTLDYPNGYLDFKDDGPLPRVLIYGGSSYYHPGISIWMYKDTKPLDTAMVSVLDDDIHELMLRAHARCVILTSEKNADTDKFHMVKYGANSFRDMKERLPKLQVEELWINSLNQDIATRFDLDSVKILGVWKHVRYSKVFRNVECLCVRNMEGLKEFLDGKVYPSLREVCIGNWAYGGKRITLNSLIHLMPNLSIIEIDPNELMGSSLPNQIDHIRLRELEFEHIFRKMGINTIELGSRIVKTDIEKARRDFLVMQPVRYYVGNIRQVVPLGHNRTIYEGDTVGNEVDAYTEMTIGDYCPRLTLNVVPYQV